MPFRPLAACTAIALATAHPAIAQEAEATQAEPAPQTEGEAAPETPAPTPTPAPQPQDPAAPEPAPAQQEGEAAPETAPAAPEAAPQAPGEAPGEAAEAAPGGEGTAQPGQVYVRDVFTDWELRCERAQQGEDPCQLYQLLRDGQGNSVAEFALFKVPPGGDVAAGATVITPLMTLLTEPLALSVDGGEARQLQLQWCTDVGCIVQFGLSQAEVQAFQRGASATLTLVPVVAADRRETLTISLSGFTAGFAALQETTPAIGE